MDPRKPGFTSLLNKGFSITFDNGHTVSVQFGTSNYCDRRTMGGNISQGVELWESSNAEVASWGPDRKWTTKGFFIGLDDDVKGHQSPAEVLAFINWVSTL